ncbi:glucose-induced degradation protein 8 homolog [Anopheles darlingi]|uniref:glucose-induced degradation protein 8 homolog n=1 Tax=Anopheles darlingi TaxID=43151 RepID=UPI0021002EA0|nr:glucose-induced degradation protein 8 homolog [Anopheles darlingi]
MSSNVEGDGMSGKEWKSRLECFPFQQSNIGKLIINYLVEEGFKEVAEEFQRESGFVPSVNRSTGSLDIRFLIREEVQNGCIQETIRLANQLHPELFDNDPSVYIHLQELQFIELIRKSHEKIEEALTFAQEHFPKASMNDLDNIERTMALLAFNPPYQCPFADLLEPAHRQKIASELNAAIVKIEQEENQQLSPLFNILKLILWVQSELDKKTVKYPKMIDLSMAVMDSNYQS